MTPSNLLHDRALATLVAGALGDAAGMPTQLLSRAEIRARYGFVDGFVAPCDDHPVSRGLPAGTITDDTEQTLLLARLLTDTDNSFDHRRWIDMLVAWEEEVRRRGSQDLLGPSTKKAIEAIKAGVPAEEAGRYGDTNGAAMRIAPLGIMMPPEPLEAIVAKTAETCRATHNTLLAIASAASVAAAISCGISGGSWTEACRHAIAAARLAAGAIDAPDMLAEQFPDAITNAIALVHAKPVDEAMELIIRHIGTSVASQESVPAAFAVTELANGDPWQAAIIAANLGGDTDTIGAIAAGMAGACTGMAALAQEHIDALMGFNITEVRSLSTALVQLRLKRLGDKEAL